MAVTNIDLIEPLQGQNVGMVMGIPREGIALTGTSTTYQIPEEYLPVFNRTCDGPPTHVGDITVYEDNVEVGVAEINPVTGVVTLEAVPSNTDGITADFVEEFEPYIAQVVNVDTSYDEETYGRLRSTVKKKLYGAREVTLSIDLLLGDLSSTRLFFDPATGEMLEEPTEVMAYVVLERGATGLGRLYFTSARMVPTSLFDASEGDTVKNSIELTVDTNPILWDPDIQRLPIADFSATPRTGEAPEEVTFTNLSTGDELEFLWDFGDGSVDSDDEHPVHTYQNSGDYTVTLKAHNDAGEDIKVRMNYIILTSPG